MQYRFLIKNAFFGRSLVYVTVSRCCRWSAYCSCPYTEYNTILFDKRLDFECGELYNVMRT